MWLAWSSWISPSCSGPLVGFVFAWSSTCLRHMNPSSGPMNALHKLSLGSANNTVTHRHLQTAMKPGGPVLDLFITTLQSLSASLFESSVCQWWAILQHLHPLSSLSHSISIKVLVAQAARNANCLSLCPFSANSLPLAAAPDSRNSRAHCLVPNPMRRSS